MSSEFTVFIKKTDEDFNHEKDLCLYSLSTTPTRRFIDSNYIKYDSNVKLDIDALKELSSNIRLELNVSYTILKDFTEQVDKLGKSLPQASNVDVYKQMQNDLNDITDNISELKEDIEFLEGVINAISFLIDILRSNKNCELYYIVS